MKRIYSIILIISFVFYSCSGSKEQGEEISRQKITERKEAVRGVWLTNVDSDALFSKAKTIEAVKLCEEVGINTIYVVVWNKAMTLYPSKIMKEFTGVEIDTNVEKGYDPLKTLIEEAHKRDIKVIAWFEFGFAAAYQKKGEILLEKKPQWKAIDKNGKLVVKNGFKWMNGFLPEVQDFLMSLIMEVVKNYDVDGIQGDDRLPAMPSESGYDEYTVSLYEKEFGRKPPEDHYDKDWLQWRANILNEFAKRIYEETKKVKPNLIVSMAPSIYPWSLEEYLQDWPTWIKNGNVDLLCPQVYRYEFEKYKETFEEIVTKQLPSDFLIRFSPGILLKVGDYYPTEEYLMQMINLNRQYGVYGESFFFYEGIKKFKDLFKTKIYPEKYYFPKVIQN